MTQVFISYASADRPVAQRLATALERLGLPVWWDRELLAGDNFDQAIERELDRSACVIVLWSPRAVASTWVRAEASSAAQRDALVPVWIEAVRLPLEFRQRHTLDLSDWAGDDGHAGFQELLRAVRARLSSSPAAPPVDAAQPPRSAAPMGRRWALGAVMVGAVAIGVAFIGWPRGERSEPESAVAPPTPLQQAISQAAGRYVGDIQAAVHGPSRSSVVVQLKPHGARGLEVDGDDPRIGRFVIEVDQVGTGLTGTLQDQTLLSWELKNGQPTLSLNPRGELAYVGRRL